MTGDNEKTQPQELLEEVIGITHGDTPEFPTLEEQAEHWRQKDLEENRAEVDPDAFKCLTCDRKFKSAQAVRMHVARVHTKTILTVGQQNQNPTSLREVTDKTRRLPKFPDVGRPVGTLDTRRKKWSLARRRAFNRQKREKMLAVSTGALPSPWHEVPPPPQETVEQIKHCPYCAKNIERFLA